MSLPEISFRDIRPIDGSRQNGFEELCCQLASLEPAQDGSRHCRKGRGGDAGVEYFVRHPDGKETAWQAKYLFRWNHGTTSQLDTSIRVALEKHPQLTEYVVCLPLDLSDSRSGRGVSALEKWERWRGKWEKHAAKKHRELAITLWGRSELCSRLARDDPAYGGRVLYWFGVDALTPEWFRQHFEKSRVSLGSRYTPETNVELPIRQDFVAFARHPHLQNEIDGWHSRLAEKEKSAVRAVRETPADGARDQADCVATAVDALAVLLDSDPVATGLPYPTEAWTSTASACLDVARDALHWCFDLPLSEPGTMGVEPEQWARHTVHELVVTLQDIADALSSTRWRMANANAVLLEGPAGIGKSHLIADVVNHHLQQNGPAVLLLGGAFVDGEPWPQIRDRLDRPSTEQFRHFLGALDAAAQAAGARALLCIDALNERHGVDVWPERLAAFLRDIEPFPRVRIVLSCRSTYVRYVIPDGLDSDKLARVEHEGFAGDGGEAASTYLDMRGTVRPGVPNIVPEFQNPLFLKTCCDALDAAGQTELPKGLRGVTSIFDFYKEALVASLSRRMKLDPRHDIIPKAISGLARLLLDSRDGYVDTAKAVDLFESILRSDGGVERSLLSQLESEGLLTVEPLPQHDGSISTAVRFTFERYSDHAIASRLLNDHLDETDVERSFGADRPLHEFVHGPRNYETAGVIEAMAIQLPERTGVEILDVAAKPSPLLRRAFLESLLWREQSYFSKRTFELAQELMRRGEFYDLLISLATEPSNKFNARFLHRDLLAKPMPERDVSWSIRLAKRGLEGSVKTLITWATRSSHERIDTERALLAGTMLTWLFTTSHREVRDKATKALACLLSRRLPLAARLLDEFATVDDPYVMERLLAACYGAAIQGGHNDGLSELAEAVYIKVFSERSPPTNALLRDHALGLLQYAAHRGVLPDSVDMTGARPPYHSAWSIEHVPDELIESYTEPRGAETFHDDIVGSTVHQGDFARYVVEHIVDAWSPVPTGTRDLPTDLDSLRSWQEEFTANATAAQLEALDAYATAATACVTLHHQQSSPELTRLVHAERSLKSVMTAEQWEDFRVRAKLMLQHPRLGRSDPKSAARFDAGWALRWICKRAHEIGWTSARFGAFERRCRTHDRYDHRVERVGKKYQWLALQELVARMADNLTFVGGIWDEDKTPRPVYRTARQVGLRDMDPSLLVTRTHYDGWAEWGRTWWVPFDPRLRPVEPHERIAWLRSDTDLVNSSALIELVDPKTGRRWLALDGFAKWTDRGVRDGHREMQRDTWFRLRCIVVNREHEEQAFHSLKNRLYLDDRSLPKADIPIDFYLGEISWHPDMDQSDPRESPPSRHSRPHREYPTTATYTCERGKYDYSIDRTIRVEIPVPWLADSMRLRMQSGRSPVFVDSDGQNTFMDPSVLEPGPPAALVDRNAFLRVLDQLDLAAIWVIAGQKGAYGGRGAAMGFGGCLNHTALYRLEGDGLSRSLYKKWDLPHQDQLESMFGTSNVPPGIPTRTRC